MTGRDNDGIDLAVIGGSGFYELEGLEAVEKLSVETPYGPPSDVIQIGRLGERRVAFIARHGTGHRLPPAEVPYRANVWALAQLGARRLVSVNAAGSLREEIEPLHFVVPDQLIDRTSGQRAATFFEGGIAGHISFDEPFCSDLSSQLAAATVSTGAVVHLGGDFLVIEGPAFSTRAESRLYRAWGASIIGMTALPEAKLAREAGICYASLACITDYDTWHPAHGTVSVELIIANLLHCPTGGCSVGGRVASLGRLRLQRLAAGIDHHRLAPRAAPDAAKAAPHPARL
jgi:5'-methylthioadenosine phosphorylase